MLGELIAIDLETTGLDPNQDSIIEVGAVRTINGEVVAEFSTLVNPGIQIPSHITHLTGIRSQDVVGAPKIDIVLPKLVEFTGNRPVIAHNISTEMGFLQGKHRVLMNTQPIDTYDLAAFLMPSVPRYNLHSLAIEFGIALDNAHRALDDARAAALLFWKLWERLLTLPRTLLQEIVDLSKGLNWEIIPIFESALQIPPSQNPDALPAPPTIFIPYQNHRSPLKPTTDAPKRVTPAEVQAALHESGRLAQHLPEYEYRPQQGDMASAIAEAFNEKHHLMVEAGTGTGKSLAYLLPAALWATRNQQHVVISTNTITLQDQLMTKDIPLLREGLGIECEAVVLKGRGNYLCPRRLAMLRRRRPTSLPELKTLAKILVWLLESDTGDKSEISLRGPIEQVVWQRLSAEDEDCSLAQCQMATAGACPFFKARKAAESAHLLVVNHALLISDALSDNRVLPDYQYLIVDEAHQLEDAVTNGLSFQLDQTALVRRLADLGGPKRGLLSEILANVRGVIPDKDLNRLEIFIQTIDEATTLMKAHIDTFFHQIHTFLKDIHNLRSADHTTFVRVVAPQREKASFAQVQATWATLSEYFEVLSDAMQRLTKAFGKLREYRIAGYDDFVSSADSAAQYLQEVRTQLNGFILQPDPNLVYWLSLGTNQAELPTINSAPLHIGPLVEKHLWHGKESVILTSATLRTGDNFNFTRDRLYADGIPTLEVGSPFNYAQSTLIYIPSDIPEPTDKNGYQRAVERGIIELAAALNGRILVLFTSYAHLRQTAQAVEPRLALGNIALLAQTDGMSRQALIDSFKASEKAVLFGTRSFWEGIDIPGAALSALVITRLPFNVPTDPIFAARSETYRDAFQNYAVPDAILRFRQGFGRLIRTKSDRGIVTVFDSRIASKSYGMSFLESLPDCTVKYGNLEGLGAAAADWLR